MKSLLSIRVLVPALILLLVAASIGYSYVTSRQVVHDQIMTDNTRVLRDRLNYMQIAAEQFLNTELKDSLQKLVSGFSSQPDLDALFITDNKGLIISSVHFNELGQHWSESRHDVSLLLVKQVSKVNRIIIFRKNNRLIGLTRICERGGTTLRPGKCGFIYNSINLRYHFQQASKNITGTLQYVSAVVLIGAFIIFLVLSLLLTRRTNLIISALNEFAHGDVKIRIKLSGHDELSSIGNSINKMFKNINNKQKTILDNEERLRTLINNVVDAVITIDKHGIIESFNPAAEHMFGYKHEDVIGKNVSILMDAPHHAQHDTYLRHYLETGEKRIIGKGREIEAKRKDGSIFPIELSVSEMKLSGKTVFTGIIKDITDRKDIMNSLVKNQIELVSKSNELQKAYRELEELAATDALTDIYNRGYFDERVVDEINRAKRSDKPISLLLCDIDFFKQLNDSAGHQEGDQALKKIAETMKTIFARGTDIVTRYGGEEFAIILANTDYEGAMAAAQRLLAAVEQRNIPHPSSTLTDHVTLSIGISTYDFNKNNELTPDVNKLIEQADKALYRAKENGRNQIASCA